ncbi:flagellar export/assembly protein [Thermosipho affectus]|uniref:Flagellar export/assembly protein n=1 Tax=Thermosipho affectus TaxID=660294 RepID=A0ABX3IHH9_9BACT|nr:FliH/SctL family protein [Thermosipho affectus]ONN26632.1 flagellar export/assembly protein [Thermosipho affectus]
MIIKKRYVYIDTPQVINKKNVEEKKEKEEVKQQADIIKNAQKKANEIIEKAQKKANEIIEKAKKDAQKILDESIREKENLINSQKKATYESISKLNERINFLIQKFDENILKIVEQFENDLFQLTKIIISKILEKEIDEEITKRKLNKILTHIAGMKNVKLYLNPEDIKLLDPNIISQLNNKGIEIIEDSKVQFGVIAETEIGNINTDLKFQMKLINEIIDEVLKNG